MRGRAIATFVFACACGGCTPGSSGGAVTGGSPSGNAITIDINLTSDGGGSTSAGRANGYRPFDATIAVGTAVRFQNTDGFAHTASSISGATFPTAYPFTSAALQASGKTLSGGFSTGSLPAGTTSETLLADTAGTYIFGCFYHYGSPMRAALEVR